jgi:hypothetical protein
MRDRLAEVRAPILVLRGERDPIAPARWADQAERLAREGFRAISFLRDFFEEDFPCFSRDFPGLRIFLKKSQKTSEPTSGLPVVRTSPAHSAPTGRSLKRLPQGAFFFDLSTPWRLDGSLVPPCASSWGRPPWRRPSLRATRLHSP